MTEKSSRVGRLILVASLLLAGCTQGESTDGTLIIRSTVINGLGYSLVIGDQIIGFTTNDEGSWYLTAVSLENGDILWKSREPSLGSQRRSSIVSDGTHLLHDAGNDLRVYLLDGTELASISYPNPFEGNTPGARLILKNNKLFVPNGNWFYVYDVSNPTAPTLQWQSEQPKILSGVAVDERGDVYVTLFAGNYDNSVFKLASDDGRELWRTGTHDLDIDSLYTGTYTEIVSGYLVVEAKSRYIAYDLQTGQKAWISDPLICDDAGYQNAYSFLEVDGTIYRNSGGGSCILAMDASNGKLLWTFNTLGTPASYTFGGRPALHEGNLYASNGRLFTVDATTGELVNYSPDERATQSALTHVHIYKGQVVVWGQNLTLFEPVK